MYKNIYEIFDELKNVKTKEERIKVLRDNNSETLKNVLIGIFHPRVNFTIKEIPPYNTVENLPPGMAYENMPMALKRIYLFMEGNPRVPLSLTKERKEQLLIQILESLEPREAEVFMNIILKNNTKSPYRVPELTTRLVNEAFPGLIPETPADAVRPS
jgi:hypothetical protein